MESSSGPFPYSTFLPTPSTSWRCFSSSFFLKWIKRSFFIVTSLPRGFAASRAGYHGVPSNAIRVGSTLDGYERRISPETLERVEAARLLEEDVHHHVTVVEQEPAALRTAFVVAGAHAPRA